MAACGAALDLVAVSVSPLQSARHSDFIDLIDLIDQVREVLRDTGLPAEQLQLELTEGTLLADNASSLGLSVTAEGMDTPEQREHLLCQGATPARAMAWAGPWPQTPSRPGWPLRPWRPE